MSVTTLWDRQWDKNVGDKYVFEYLEDDMARCILLAADILLSADILLVAYSLESFW